MATAKAKSSKKWPVEAAPPPALSSMEWNKMMLLGVVLIVVAVLQIVSFNDFENALSAMGLSGAAAWAGVLIFCELWAGISLFKVRLSRAFRMVGLSLAVLVGLFWFFQSIRVATSGLSLTSMGFFGRFLTQAPSWWTVIEATVLLVWTLWAFSVSKDK
jgi:hypothetical protein